MIDSMPDEPEPPFPPTTAAIHALNRLLSAEERERIVAAAPKTLPNARARRRVEAYAEQGDVPALLIEATDQRTLVSPVLDAYEARADHRALCEHLHGLGLLHAHAKVLVEAAATTACLLCRLLAGDTPDWADFNAKVVLLATGAAPRFLETTSVDEDSLVPVCDQDRVIDRIEHELGLGPDYRLHELPQEKAEELAIAFLSRQGRLDVADADHGLCIAPEDCALIGQWLAAAGPVLGPGERYLAWPILKPEAKSRLEQEMAAHGWVRVEEAAVRDAEIAKLRAELGRAPLGCPLTVEGVPAPESQRAGAPPPATDDPARRDDGPVPESTSQLHVPELAGEDRS